MKATTLKTIAHVKNTTKQMTLN